MSVNMYSFLSSSSSFHGNCFSFFNCLQDEFSLYGRLTPPGVVIIVFVLHRPQNVDGQCRPFFSRAVEIGMGSIHFRLSKNKLVKKG